MSSSWGLMKENAGGSMSLQLQLLLAGSAVQFDLQTLSHFTAVPSPSPKSPFQC